MITGVSSGRRELLILADDDVRYTLAGLQNYFPTMPCHARIDTARSLINRAFGADYPGTFGVRRAALMRTGGYDGDVLFENLEMLRTIKAAGGQEVIASNLHVGRTVPTVAHFLNQQTRQAYDSLAQPGRFGVELCLLPLLSSTLYMAAVKRRCWPAMTFIAVAIAIAEAGRRAGGRLYHAAHSSGTLKALHFHRVPDAAVRAVASVIRCEVQVGGCSRVCDWPE